MKAVSFSMIRSLLFLLLVFIILYYGKSFLMPIVTGGILATVFLPFCKWFENKGIPKGLAAFICLMILILIVASISALLVWKVSTLSNDIEVIKQKISDTVMRIQTYIFTDFGVSREVQSRILIDEKPSVSVIMQKMGGSLTYIVFNSVFIFAYVFLFLYYRDHIRQFMVKISGPSNQGRVLTIAYAATLVTRQYLVGLAKMILCLWIMCGLGFTLLGVKNALFFAILCGLLEIIPFIGNLVGTSLTVLFAALHGAGIPVLAGIVIIYGIVQFVQGWILEPLIVGRQVKINPLFTIIALVAGELIWGISGIFLALPVTAICKVVCDHIEALHPYGFLIGNIKPGKKGLKIIRKVRHLYKSS